MSSQNYDNQVKYNDNLMLLPSFQLTIPHRYNQFQLAFGLVWRRDKPSVTFIYAVFTV
jgi:hypothetical protein